MTRRLSGLAGVWLMLGFVTVALAQAPDPAAGTGRSISPSRRSARGRLPRARPSVRGDGGGRQAVCRHRQREWGVLTLGIQRQVRRQGLSRHGQSERRHDQPEAHRQPLVRSPLEERRQADDDRPDHDLEGRQDAHVGADREERPGSGRQEHHRLRQAIDVQLDPHRSSLEARGERQPRLVPHVAQEVAAAPFLDVGRAISPLMRGWTLEGRTPSTAQSSTS